MAMITDSAVVLRQLDYSEASQIIVFFAREHGKVRAIAKGVKRSTKTRFAVGIDLLDIGELVVSCRAERSASLAIVVEWKPVRGLLGLRGQLRRLYAGQYAAEITAQLTEDWDPHPAAFDGLVATLTRLAEADEVLEWTVRYQLLLLGAIGLLPRFDRCVLCSRQRDLTYFSSIEGGVICRHCEPGQVEKREITSAVLSAIHGKSPTASYVGAFGLLDYHISHLMGREPMLASKLVSSARRRLLE
ncbi:MAG: DNA repair protein RecO [Phycisphaerae bacterium]